MRSSEFISTDEIVSEASEYLNDSGFTHGVGRSFYETVVHRTVEELALSTFFNKVTKDIFDWNACGNGYFQMPANTFNLKEIYLFNSKCDSTREKDDEGQPCPCGCSQSKTCWTSFVEAHYKRQYNRFGTPGLKTSGIPGNQYDPVHARMVSVPTGLVYYGMQNGDICISDSGLSYKNVRIVANGFGSSNCELPIIPRELRKAVVDKTVERIALKIKLTHPEYRAHWIDAQSELYGNNTVQKPGSWLSATRFIVSLDSKRRDDLAEYFSNIDVK